MEYAARRALNLAEVMPRAKVSGRDSAAPELTQIKRHRLVF